MAFHFLPIRFIGGFLPYIFRITACLLLRRRCSYVALCFPFYRLKHYLRARSFIAPILVLAPLYNVPRFFEYEIRSRVARFCANFSGGGEFEVAEADFANLTEAEVAACDGEWEESETAQLVVTDFRKDATYIQVGVVL